MALATTPLASSSSLWRRKWILKAKIECSLSYSSFKRLVPGGVNWGLIGPTCTALVPYLLLLRVSPRAATRRAAPLHEERHGVAAQHEIESNI